MEMDHLRAFEMFVALCWLSAVKGPLPLYWGTWVPVKESSVAAQM